MARVLIIDDEERVRRFLAEMLIVNGHDPIETEDGRAGLEKAADPSVALILSDLVLPGGLSGVPLIRQLREARPTCPIVVISGHPSEETIAACRALDVTDFLTKPFEMGFLQELLARYFPKTGAPPRRPSS